MRSSPAQQFTRRTVNGIGRRFESEKSRRVKERGRRVFRQHRHGPALFAQFRTLPVHHDWNVRVAWLGQSE